MLKFLCCCILSWSACENTARPAIPDHALLKSPSGDYSVRVTKRSGSGSAGRSLEIMHHGSIEARYPFEGELASGYWSPSGRYVAINNHSGYNGWWLWIISLKDGRIIRTKGAAANPNYDRYSDDQCTPDLFDSAEASEAIAADYSESTSDQMRAGYTTIGYGWRKGDILLVHHRLVFDHLAAGDKSIIQVLEMYKVSPKGITDLAGSVHVKRVKLSNEEKEEPAEVKPLFE